jgi:hypothetical protein
LFRPSTSLFRGKQDVNARDKPGHDGYRYMIMDNVAQVPDLREQIAKLEVKIEELGATQERCRKFIQAGKTMIATGLVLVLVMAAGVIKAGLVSVLLAVIATIGGIVVFGSNVSTSRQLAEAIAAAEALRAELIGRIALRVIPGGLLEHPRADGQKSRGILPTQH